MIEIPVWVLWVMLTGPAGTIVAVMLFMSRFTTKDDVYGRMRDCQDARKIEIGELQDNRKEVWSKIDEIKDDTTQIKISIASLTRS